MEIEQKKFCDLLQFDYIEHYNNNTIKQLHAMQYLYQQFGVDQNIPLEYVLRADDDVFINIPMLNRLLSQVSTRR